MARYVDGFLIPIPKKNIASYLKLARKCGAIWRELGALEYRECVGDDLKTKGVAGFPKIARMKRNETVLFSWIVYKSRAHRDRVNARVMKDPRIAAMMSSMEMPFDIRRMAYGGFTIRVEA